MRISITGAVFAIVGALSGCTSTPSATQLASADTQAPVDPNAKTCRSMIVTGSTLPKRVCQTQAEWDAYDDAFSKSNESYKTDRYIGQNKSQR